MARNLRLHSKYAKIELQKYKHLFKDALGGLRNPKWLLNIAQRNEKHRTDMLSLS